MSNPAKLGQMDHGSFVRVQVGKVSVDLGPDDRIAKSILSGKPFEPDTLAFFGDHVKPGTRVFDVGCYSGLFAIAATKMGAIATGFEPMPDNYRQIEFNQRRNATYFLLSHVALSDKTGKAQIKYNPTVHLTSGASLERKSGPSMEIDTATLDEYMLPFHFDDMPISIIKMDVERHEPAVIRGARLTIDRYKPILIVEANDLKAREDVIKSMEGLDYMIKYELDVRNLVFVPN